MKNLKLSFIIPAYNEEKFIGQCLKSIIAQTKNKPYATEIIVVNNASTDATKKIAAAFAGVKVVDEPKKGLVRARRAGFLASSGDLIANVDADTVLPSGWVAKVFAEFYQNDKLAALSGPHVYYDLPKLTRVWVRLFYYLGYVSYLINHYILRVGAMLQGGNFIVRRSALEKIGGYNLNFDFYGEDTEIARRLSKVGQVKFTFSLPIYTTGRRLKAEGVLTMAIRYGINYFSAIFLKKPLTKKVNDIT